MSEDWEDSCVLKCCNIKCPMVHHRHSNCCFFRCCSMSSSFTCLSATNSCLDMSAIVGDETYYKISRCNEGLNEEGADFLRKISTVVRITCFPLILIKTLMLLVLSGFFWILSVPGLCCGDNKIEDEWSDKCFNKTELFSAYEKRCDMCDCCRLAKYTGPG